MTLSVIVSVVIVVASFYWVIRSIRKEVQRRANLHITPRAGRKEY